MKPERRKKIRLGELLIEQKVINEAQLNQALSEQKKTGRLFRPADRYVGPEPRSLSAV